MGLVFESLRPKWFPRKNIGADIGGYMDLARDNPDADGILCMGESCFFHRAGWMDRIDQVWKRLGPGFYGFFSSNLTNPHLNTTAFLCPPIRALLNADVEARPAPRIASAPDYLGW